MKKLNGQFIRFVFVGVINTLNYYFLYLFFIHLINLEYLLSHILAFIISMVGSFFMNTLFTYKTSPSIRKFFTFPLTYVVNISVTTASMYTLVDLLHFNVSISPILTSLIAIPFTFMASKRILLSKKVTKGE
jgi:putative flippase GtrA